MLTASSDFTPSFEGGKQEVETEVVIKDRMLDTVAIAHLGWLVESKEA